MLNYLFPTLRQKSLNEDIIEDRIGYYVDDPLKVTIKSSIIRKTVKNFIPLELDKYVDVRGNYVFVHGLLIPDIKKLLEYDSAFLLQTCGGED